MNDSERDTLLIRLDSRTEEMHRVLITGTEGGEPSVVKRVSDLERGQESQKGWVRGAAAVWAFLLAAWGILEWFFHRPPPIK